MIKIAYTRTARGMCEQCRSDLKKNSHIVMITQGIRQHYGHPRCIVEILKELVATNRNKIKRQIMDIKRLKKYMKDNKEMLIAEEL